jgi:hypothetical protein
LDPHVAAHIRFVSDIFFFAQLTWVSVFV